MMKKLVLFLLSFLVLGQSCIFSQTCNAKDSFFNDNSTKFNEDKVKTVGSLLKYSGYAGALIGIGTLAALVYTNVEERQPYGIKLFSIPEDLKSIHWQDNLCWFNTTILMFYYHPTFYDCILSFPVEEAEKILCSRKDLDPKERDDLEAFIELSKTFYNIRNCSGNVYTMPNRDLFNKLNKAIEFSYHVIDSDGNFKKERIKYGEGGNVFSAGINSLINRVINYSMKYNSLKQWRNKSCDSMDKLRQGMSVFSLDNVFRNAGIRQCENPGGGGHFWVEVNKYNALWEIGYSICDNDSIKQIPVK